MTRDDKNIVFLSFLFGLPAVSWLCMAAWRYGIGRPLARGLVRIARLTPQDQFLMGALGVGLAAGFCIAHRIVQHYDTQFGGAGFRRFLRGTRMTSHRGLQQQTREANKVQVLVADTPIPTWLETWGKGPGSE